ncbi:MAG TPA: hypothetical protein VF453_17955 [Burkholderiaceae bacterium]
MTQKKNEQRPLGRTNWERVLKQTDEDIERQAASDPDAPLVDVNAHFTKPGKKPANRQSKPD